jgi:hypothetical protein
MVKQFKYLYVVMRFDKFYDSPIEERVRAKEIVSTQEEAEKEVERLNHLVCGKKDVIYFWDRARILEK